MVTRSETGSTCVAWRGSAAERDVSETFSYLRRRIVLSPRYFLGVSGAGRSGVRAETVSSRPDDATAGRAGDAKSLPLALFAF